MILRAILSQALFWQVAEAAILSSCTCHQVKQYCQPHPSPSRTAVYSAYIALRHLAASWQQGQGACAPRRPMLVMRIASQPASQRHLIQLQPKGEVQLHGLPCTLQHCAVRPREGRGNDAALHAVRLDVI